MDNSEAWRRQQQIAWTYFQRFDQFDNIESDIEQLWNNPNEDNHEENIRILIICFAELLLLNIFAESKSKKRLIAAIAWLIDHIYLCKDTNLAKISEALTYRPDIQRVFLIPNSSLWVEASSDLFDLAHYSDDIKLNFDRHTISRGRDDLYKVIKDNLPELYENRYEYPMFQHATIQAQKIPRAWQKSEFIIKELDFHSLIVQMPTKWWLVDDEYIAEFTLPNHAYIQKLSTHCLKRLISRAIALDRSKDYLPRALSPLSPDIIREFEQIYDDMTYAHNRFKKVNPLYLESLCFEIIDFKLAQSTDPNPYDFNCQLCIIFGIDSDGKIIPLFFEIMETEEQWTDIFIIFDANEVLPRAIICKSPHLSRRNVLRFITSLNIVTMPRFHRQ